MEQTRKNLKMMSLVVLALAGLSLVNLIFEIFFGELDGALNSAAIPEGSPDNIVMIAKIFVLVISVLLLVPHVYIGLKGIKMAKAPDGSKGHIVWGIILLVLTILDLITPFLALVRGGDAFGNISELCSIIVDACILYEYVHFAKAVRAGI